MLQSVLSLALSWLVGALALAPIELVALGSARPSLVWAVASLLAGLGLACGLVIGLVEQLAQELGAHRPAAALVRALPAAVPCSWVALHLFDGGMASTLPGAAWAWLWVPLVGVLATAVALLVGARMASGRRTRLALPIALALIIAAVEYGNRTVLTREYPDVHGFLVVVAAVCAGALVCAVRGLAGARPASDRPGRAPARRAQLLGAAVLAPALVSSALVLPYGLAARADRYAVATRGMAARQLARVWRAALDLDGDGHASVLGGGDCAEGDPRVHPDADDLPGDGIDQDCDGEDAAPAPAPPPVPQDDAQALAAWRQGPEVRDLVERARGYHIIFIVVDALRADALAMTDENLSEYPNLSALAAESRRFDHAFSPAAGTDVSLWSLSSGRVNPFVVIDTTLFEALAATGRRTHAVLPREVLRWAGESFLTRGLASHDVVITDQGKRDVGDHSTSAETTDFGLAFLDAHTQAAPATPVFLWLHYFDVHEHHQLPDNDQRLRQALGHDRALDRRAKYRAVTRLVDGEIGRLRAALEARGLWQETAIFFMADHGESLGEDPRLPDTHGRFLYNPLVHVPLLVRIPGVAPGVIERPVSLLDVAPTVLALVGRPPLPAMDGEDLLPWLAPGAPAAARARIAPIPLNESEQRGVIDWPYKLLERPADNLVELYDLAADFAELHDLSSEHPDLVKQLRARYRAFLRVVYCATLEGRKRRDALARPR